METVIIGLPSSGKTTIFNALTGRSVPVGDFSAAGRQVHLADVPVPDVRVDRLSALYRPKKTTYATVLFRDPPLAYQEDGALSPAGLGEVRKADAVTVVLRAFENDSVPHPLKEVNPLRDLRAVLDSLVLADYEVAEKRLARLEKEAKRDGREYQVLKTIVERLGAGQLLGRGFFSAEDEKLFSGFAFLTAKPVVAVLNDGERSVDHAGVEDEARSKGIAVFPIRGDLEAEIAQLDTAEQAEFLKDLGASEPAKHRFLRTRLRPPRPGELPHRRRGRGPGVEHPPRHHRLPRERHHPHRPREGVHPGRGRRGGKTSWPAAAGPRRRRRTRSGSRAGTTCSRTVT